MAEILHFVQDDIVLFWKTMRPNIGPLILDRFMVNRKRVNPALAWGARIPGYAYGFDVARTGQ